MRLKNHQRERTKDMAGELGMVTFLDVASSASAMAAPLSAVCAFAGKAAVRLAKGPLPTPSLALPAAGPFDPFGTATGRSASGTYQAGGARPAGRLVIIVRKTDSGRPFADESTQTLAWSLASSASVTEMTLSSSVGGLVAVLLHDDASKLAARSKLGRS